MDETKKIKSRFLLSSNNKILAQDTSVLFLPSVHLQHETCYSKRYADLRKLSSGKDNKIHRANSLQIIKKIQAWKKVNYYS